MLWVTRLVGLDPLADRGGEQLVPRAVVQADGQELLVEHADEVFERMDNGAHMYFCGLKGMMPGITEMLESVSKEKGLVWEDKLKEWKSKNDL